MMRCIGRQPRADLLSSHDKGQEREEPYEATSLTYGSEAAAGRATEPPTVTCDSLTQKIRNADR